MCGKSTGCKRQILWALLALALFSLMILPAGAFQRGEVVGRVPILLRTSAGDSLKNATNQDSALGNAAAEAARISAGTELAILNGGDLGDELPPREVTWEEVQAAFSTDRELAKATITVEELWRILEAGVSHAVLDEHLKIDRQASSFGGFPQIAGFHFTYDMSAPVGQRIYSVTLDSGEALSLENGDRELTLCATGFMLSGGYDYPILETDVEFLGETTAEALADALRQGELEAVDYGGKIRVIGSGDDTLLSTDPMIVILFLAVMVLATAGLKLRRKMEFRRE